MRLLLDTCTIVYAVAVPERISDRARSVLVDDEAEMFISPISCAEIACLCERGRLDLDRHWKTWFNHFVPLNGWRSLDIDLRVVQEAFSLPGEFHSDPADRILAATARINDLAIVTADSKLLDYPHVETIW